MTDPKNSGELLKQTSIIICTVDRFAELEACLKSLAPFKSQVAEIIVVNNGPRPTDVEDVARHHDATVVHESRRGVSHARNAGIHAAIGSVVAFLDDDSLADSNWLSILLEPLRDSKVFAVVGSIASQSLSDPVSRAFDELHRAQFPESPVVLSSSNAPREFPMRMALVGNANMAIQREAFELFGFFDVRFGRGSRIGSGEEPDLLLRVLLGGGKIAVEPRARILHLHSTDMEAIKRWAFTSGCAHTAMLTKYFFRGLSSRGRILEYAASRLRRSPTPANYNSAESRPPKVSFLLGSLYGPLAYFLSRKS